ncbi:MAG TPA: Stk1 family PASTA domain-containing Ser/Thr kinase [Thermoleophilia bacterium]|nr:Stk1 family PASTA domain-containing Ser/Thr kinase [Thermoleophilia bacterium]HQG03411.1 Stk1 family PASTA domain-containing Ser/Thr kinase [Thermoleophilia bacterium]HQG54786.1 Stk1 family PASTA domain-containing Ser/Thr kinase [Thermoleophilia bacterium]
MADAFQPDDIVNQRYRVLRKLGAGGMADVYLCEDLTLGRRVALKVLSSRFVHDAQFVERFRREAKAAAGLNHPNLVAIHDWGEIDGTYFIVMEYVEGETLKELIRRRGRLNGGEAVEIALGLLAAVGYAHRHGVVHRDIKSQNILLDASGTVKVTDFGIARAGESGMTEAGSVLGTAQYLAPEQARGEVVDERSDLYSVGIVLYEMLTGRVPFSGDSAVTVAMKHVNERPPEPAELVPGMPYSLNQIVMKALAKDPALRYQTADEFARDLRAAQAGGPVLAAAYDASMEQTQLMGTTETQVMTRPMPAAPAPRPRKSRRTLWIVLLLLAVIAAAGAALYWTMSGERVAVPDLVGRSEAQAKQVLEGLGFKVEVKDTYSDDFSAGFVARQSPEGGAELKEGAAVTIWVSRGAKTVVLPDFRGWKAADVAAWLKENGLEEVRKEGRSDDVAQGRVYRQDPSSGTSVTRGETVTYWVSSGAPQVEVPDLTGMMRADAIATLVALGLKVGTVTSEPSTTYDVDQVMRQDPGEGEKVDKGTAVDLVVSSGPPSPSPTATATLVEVPEVVTMDAATAQSTLEAAGFAVNVKEKTSPEPPGTVIRQSPAAGTMAREGAVVTIWVAK